MLSAIAHNLDGQSPTLQPANPDDAYWLVVKDGSITARARAGAPERTFTNTYNPLRPTDEVYCRLDVPPPSPQRKKQPQPEPACSLRYVSSLAEPQLLTDKLPANRWLPLATVKDLREQTPPQLVKTNRALIEEMRTKTRRGGVDKASGCTGVLPVVAPACLETIDIDDFAIEWSAGSIRGTYASLFIDTRDERQTRSMRLDRIALREHRFSDPRIKRFLEDVQRDDQPTSVLIRLSQAQGVEAIRVITVPSKIEQNGYRAELAKIDAQQPAIRQIGALSVYIKFALWTKAALQARELLVLEPDDEFIKAYALVGFCQSGYTHETETLRTSLRAQGTNDICPVGGQ